MDNKFDIEKKFEDLEDNIRVSLLEEVMKHEMSSAKSRAKDRRRKDDKTIHITDLLYCPKKAEYSKMYPELQAEVSLRPAVFQGKCFERGLSYVVRSWAKDTGRKVKLWHKGKKRLLYNGDLYTIVGEADIVILKEVKEGKDLFKDEIETIIEVKNKVWNLSATDNYILQAKMYGWLFDVSDVRLWLFVNKGGRGYKEIVLNDTKMSDDDVLTFLEAFLLKKKVPLWDWECGYCPYRSVCDVRK